MASRPTSWLTIALAFTACGGTTPGDTQGGDGEDDGVATTDASASGSGSGQSSAGSGGQDEGTSAASSTAGGTDSAADEWGTAGLPKYDVHGMPDYNAMPCGEGMGDPEFSFLWASNSSQGTISKIDTQTVQEMGRYIVRPDSAGSPSRTSVNLAGDVAVANRNGGVTKIYAIEERCEDMNGNGMIETSGNNQALAWGTEECIAWHTPFAYASQRPVAWTQGTFNDGTCAYENAKLWTSGSNGPIDVILMDGDTGAILDMVTVPGLNQDFYGIYGGAVDGEGNFWGTQLGSGSWLVRVDIDDLTYTVYDPPNGPHWYGMTVDSDGYVWMCSDTAGRFDPMTETFQTNVVGGYTGCMAEAGPDGLLWMSTGAGVVGVDRDTLGVVVTWPTPGSYGISIDYYGYVWAVASGNSAHRVDPVTGEVVSYNGLVGAYTYSDMTGYALTHAGGGAPSG